MFENIKDFLNIKIRGHLPNIEHGEIVKIASETQYAKNDYATKDCLAVKKALHEAIRDLPNKNRRGNYFVMHHNSYGRGTDDVDFSKCNIEETKNLYEKQFNELLSGMQVSIKFIGKGTIFPHWKVDIID